MFDHLSIGVSDLDRSLAFYDAALRTLGASRMFSMGDRGIAAFNGAGGTSFWIYAKGSNQVPLQLGSAPQRFHLAFRAENRAQVDAFYQAAIAANGTDEGAPGIRAQYHANYYAAYVRDPDGYKIEVVCQQAV